ncbi:MAG TPA: hypothetical protein VM870_02845, partial [Pyrinomonadaceae bacterium]|nr:hypothetical protein [Pyrinomonadaceae bacterium]
VLLCGAGIPSQFEECVVRRYFTRLHYLALVCSDEELAGRSKARPAWRGSSGPVYIREHVAYNRWLKENATHTDPTMTLLNTSHKTVEEAVREAIGWVGQALGQEEVR